MHRYRFLVIALASLFCVALSIAKPIDQLSFGDEKSEQEHGLKSDHTEAISGGLGENARRLTSLEPVSWEGGRVSFTLKIDPEKDNYFTVRLWGSDTSA